MSTLSVAIPAYNEETNLADCLDKLLAQTRPIDEIIVVDNGSTDRTIEIAHEYSARFRSVRLVQESTRGIHHARRRGLDCGTGEILAKVDADTRVPSDWAENGMKFFTADRGLDTDFAALTGPFLLHDAPMMERQKRLAEKSYRKLRNGGPIGSVHGPAYFIRRDAWRRIRSDLHDNEPVWEDLDIGLTLHEHGFRVYFDPCLLAESSCRRMQYAPWRNIGYGLGGLRTARAHRNRRMVVSMSVDLPIRLATYAYFWLLFRPWDHESRTWRPHRYLLPLDRTTRPQLLDEERLAA
ncbi:glycosyltransferase [Gordonia alkanivorans]|uniref:glycosyltransferase family 2 protein n=1 Tax=Gordonia alkanivorans TaxID=84096 RepID=UPI0024B83337|nr:glycosyltransferase [Gordonia alkanivorans]MDJ0025661.1 glycosyltransferase [Gordonia alkanivorans]